MRYYDQTAHLYNARYAGEQSCKMDAALNCLKSNTYSKCIDLGCGTGLLLTKIVKSGNIVVGLDISKGMLKEVECSLKHSMNVHLIQADMDYIPVRPRSFDVVFAVTILQNTPCPQRSLREMKRITTRDATMIVTGLKKCFASESLLTLLHDAGFQPSLSSSSDAMKCHIASCRKAHDGP